MNFIHIWVTTNVDKFMLGISGKKLVTKFALANLNVKNSAIGLTL